MEKTDNYIHEIKSKLSLGQIARYFDQIGSLSVLVIGDIIIDKYVFVSPKGRAVKDPILSVEYKNDETYAGGILAVTNHLSDFVKKIRLVTLIGDRDHNVDFIKKSLKGNVELKTFVKENSPTIIKERFIDYHRNTKLFKIEYMNDAPISKKLTDEIVHYLDEELLKHDLVIVGDFGHGFINEAIRRKLEEKSKFLALNVQSNSANMGYNYFNLYKRMDFISMDEQELRMPFLMRFEDIKTIINKVILTNFSNPFLVTRGSRGCVLINRDRFVESPSLTDSVKDTIGAGDAVFAISSLLVYAKFPDELIPFIANCAGGIKVSYLGNKESISKERLINFIDTLYKNEMGRI